MAATRGSLRPQGWIALCLLVCSCVVGKSCTVAPEVFGNNSCVDVCSMLQLQPRNLHDHSHLRQPDLDQHVTAQVQASAERDAIFVHTGSDSDLPQLPPGFCYFCGWALYVVLCVIYQVRVQTVSLPGADEPPPLLQTFANPSEHMDAMTAFDKLPASSEAEPVMQEKLHDMETLVDILHPSSTRIALEAIDGSQSLTHMQLCRLMRDGVGLEQFGVLPRSRVATILPSGDHSASLLLSLLTRYAVAPLNAMLTTEELFRSIDMYSIDAVVASSEMIKRVEQLRQGPAIIESPDHLRKMGEFSLVLRRGISVKIPRGLNSAHSPTSFSVSLMNGPADTCLLLGTSGTTSKPKIVPVTLHRLAMGAKAFENAHGLREEDRCLSMMPLFHIGGIITNVISPLCAGASVICAPGLDPDRLLSWLREQRVTYYSAVPTMHMQVTERLERDCVGVNLRIVTSGAAHLPHRLAQRLRDATGASLFLTYGMTECMPISCTPQGYSLEKPHSVGEPLRVRVSIRSTVTGEAVPIGEQGEVCVCGPLVLQDYLSGGHAGFYEDTCFRTGDLGMLDADRFLYLVGRSKEVINRGGELVSPFEVEALLSQHSGVKECMAFSVPHDALGETTAVAVVRSKASRENLTLNDVQSFLCHSISQHKIPEALVFVNELPKGPTGKVQRIGFAEHVGLKPFSADMRLKERVFEAQLMRRGEVSVWELIEAPAAAGVDAEVVIDSLKQVSSSKASRDPGWEFVKLSLLFMIVCCHVDKKFIQIMRHEDATPLTRTFQPVMISGFVFVSGNAAGGKLSCESMPRLALNTLGTSFINSVILTLLKGPPYRPPITSIYWYLVCVFMWRVTIMPLLRLVRLWHAPLVLFYLIVYMAMRIIVNDLWSPFVQRMGGEAYVRPLEIDFPFIMRGFTSYGLVYAVGASLGYIKWTKMLNDQRLSLVALTGLAIWHVGIDLSPSFKSWTSYVDIARTDWQVPGWEFLLSGFGFDVLMPHDWDSQMLIGDARFYLQKLFLTFVWIWPLFAVAKPIVQLFPKLEACIVTCGRNTIYGYLLHWDFVCCVGLQYHAPRLMHGLPWNLQMVLYPLIAFLTVFAFTSELTQLLFGWLQPYDSLESICSSVRIRLQHWSNAHRGEITSLVSSIRSVSTSM